MHFGAPSILWALLALAIPVIVHLFDFRRYRKVQFSDNYLLQQLLEKNKRQSRLRRLIIMSLRMLFIAALVLAFAKPYFPQSNEPLSSGRLFVSIYVDNSLSMEVSDGKTDLLEKARSKAIEILNAYPPGTMFRLISNDFLGEHERFCPRDECADMLSLLDFCPFPRKLSAVVSRMSDLSDMNASGAEHHFYIISDFQKSTADVALLASTDRKIFLFPVDAPKTPNISVDSIWFSGPVQLENNLITVNARIRNHSDMLLEKIPVRLYVDGKQKGLGDVELAASGSDVVEFTFTVNTR
ncbi:MAG: BatA domain-containing protein, partial [Bacteroidales bacterium]|nr:BatA domain-containing protein [Bacteroidales bacterium]